MNSLKLDSDYYTYFYVENDSDHNVDVPEQLIGMVDAPTLGTTIFHGMRVSNLSSLKSELW